MEDAGSNSGWAVKTRSTPVSAIRVSSLQLHRQRGQPVLVADPGEQLVAEVPAQPGQRRRQRRLAQPHLRGGPGDAALLQQGVERHQQVEVQAGQVHRATVSTPVMPVIRHLLFPHSAVGWTDCGERAGDPSAADLDRTDPEGAIAAAAKRCSNWGRWGADDVLGTLNFLDEAKRVEGAGAGPARGELLAVADASTWTARRRAGGGAPTRCTRCSTPAPTPSAASQGFPHGIGGADDVIAMPLQASTQWDGLGPHLRPRHRLERPPRGRRRHQRRRPGHRHRDRRRR